VSLPKRTVAIDVTLGVRRVLPAGIGRSRCDIVGVSDRDEGIAKARAERFGSTPFTDYRQMIETTRPESLKPCLRRPPG
jgi:hypothetical protein